MAIPYESKPLPSVSAFGFDITSWAGVNKIKGGQGDGEMADCKNMCSENYPYASPRRSREKILDEADVKRIYKVDGNRVYYIDKDDYLCYCENGAKNFITYTENETETKIKMGNCTCTNNYDKASVFYPNVSYLDEKNKVCGREYPITFGNIVESTRNNAYNETVYEAKTEATVFLGNPNTQKLYLDFKFPSQEDVPNEHFDTIIITIYVDLYDKYDNKKSELCLNLNLETDEREKVWLCEFVNVEKGDYLKIYGYGGHTKKADGYDDIIDRLEFIKDAKAFIKDYFEDGVANSCLKLLTYGVVYNNRIVGDSGSDIRASALGDFTNLYEYADEAGSPSATGAYATDVGSVGDFTGICAYNNVLLLFKRDIVYEMYGSMPYTITELCNTGCIDNDSIASIDGVLYWASPKGIVRYSGGVPNVISTQIDIDTSTIAKAGTDGRKYYVYDGFKTYVYDTYYQMWHIEDDTNIKMCYNHINDLYMVCDDGIYKANSGSEAVEWEFETKDYTFQSAERKNLSKLWIRADMPKNSRLEIYVKQNSGDWQRVAVKTAEKDEMFDFKLRVKKCDSFSLKFKGKGDVHILDIHGKVTVGTSKHRSGASLNVYRR